MAGHRERSMEAVCAVVECGKGADGMTTCCTTWGCAGSPSLKSAIFRGCCGTEFTSRAILRWANDNGVH